MATRRSFRLSQALIGLTAIAAIAACSHESGSGSSPSSDMTLDSPRRIDAPRAVAKAREIAGADWQLAYVSNTGIAGSVTSNEFRSPAQALLASDGTAGQWVIEFFKGPPQTVKDGGRTGQGYPFRRFLVTAKSTTELPEMQVVVPKRLGVLDDALLEAIGRGAPIAMKSSPGQAPDILSVASDVSSDNQVIWRFRLYDSQSERMVGTVSLSAEGSHIVKD